MAHVEKRGARRYRVRYRDPGGRERSQTFTKRGLADDFAATVEADMIRHDWIDPRLGVITLEEWAQRWRGTTVHLKPKTIASYDSLWKTCISPTFGDRALARTEQPDVAEWVAALMKRELSASRVRQAYSLLGTMMKAAVAARRLARMPCVGIKLPRKARRDLLVPSAADVEALAAAMATEQDRLLIFTLAYGGLRWGEAAGLRRSRCDLELRSRIEVAESLAEANGVVHFGTTKTYERRWVVLPAFLRELLAEHLEVVGKGSDALVFTAPKGGPLRYHNFRRGSWDRARSRAGLPESLTPHVLRHFCASVLIASGADPVAVQRHLGHRDISTTLNIYGHLFPDRMEQLAGALDGIRQQAQSGSTRGLSAAWERP